MSNDIDLGLNVSIRWKRLSSVRCRNYPLHGPYRWEGRRNHFAERIENPAQNIGPCLNPLLLQVCVHTATTSMCLSQMQCSSPHTEDWRPSTCARGRHSLMYLSHRREPLMPVSMVRMTSYIASLCLMKDVSLR